MVNQTKTFSFKIIQQAKKNENKKKKKKKKSFQVELKGQ